MQNPQSDEVKAASQWAALPSNGASLAASEYPRTSCLTSGAAIAILVGYLGTIACCSRSNRSLLLFTTSDLIPSRPTRRCVLLSDFAYTPALLLEIYVCS